MNCLEPPAARFILAVVFLQERTKGVRTMQTKKLVVGILTTILSLPAFAEITNNATCNTTNLGQSNNNSTANVEANWNANTININWYNGDTRVAQNTCTYDGQITLPTEPTKPGYTFAGWRLKQGTIRTLVEDCESIDNEQDCNNSYHFFPGCIPDNDYVSCIWNIDMYGGSCRSGDCTGGSN